MVEVFLRGANYRLFFLLFGLATVISIGKSSIGEYDEVWHKRAEEAKKGARETYVPNPLEIIHHVNTQVDQTFEGHKINTTGRRPCRSTNPIDRCWRCNPNWAEDRKKIIDCVLGFGRNATGGASGSIYVVTSPADDNVLHPKIGTLRHAVIQNQPLWIAFAHDMVITLKQELLVTSNKTIDSRGAIVQIASGAPIILQFVQNVIIHGLHIHDIRSTSGGVVRDSEGHVGFRVPSDGVGISIYGSRDIWIDHVSMSNCQGRLIDVIQGSTAITISNCHFTNNNEVMLFGGSDSYADDQFMQITVAFNHFGRGLVWKMPRCRWGFIHVINNDYTHWLMHPIHGSQHATILSQGNRFIAPLNMAPKEVVKRGQASERRTWNWRSENDLMMNGAFFVEFGHPLSNAGGKSTIKPKPGAYAARLTRFAGALFCLINGPCKYTTV